MKRANLRRWLKRVVQQPVGMKFQQPPVCGVLDEILLDMQITAKAVVLRFFRHFKIRGEPMRAAEGKPFASFGNLTGRWGRQITYRFGVLGLEREARAIYFPKFLR
jgi:hypothetical protein